MATTVLLRDFVQLLPCLQQRILVKKYPPETVEALLSTFRILWHWYHFNPLKIWPSVRNNILVGLSKSIPGCGNTSVSMGVALSRLPAATSTPLSGGPRFQLVLNCGTGGIKYGLYGRRENGHMDVWYEYKPAETARMEGKSYVGPSPQRFWHMDESSPRGTTQAVRVTSLQSEDYTLERSRLLEEFARVQNEIGQRFGDLPMEVVAIVTGPLRDAWQTYPTLKTVIEGVLTTFFTDVAKPFDPSSSSYCITDTQEGQLEFLACQTMYRQAAVMRGVADTKQEVCWTMGMGKGSCQWSSAPTPEGVFPPASSLNVNVGMGDTGENLYMFESHLQRAWRQEPVQRETERLLTTLTWTAPILALKSGCMLILEKAENQQAIQAALAERAAHRREHTFLHEFRLNLMAFSDVLVPKPENQDVEEEEEVAEVRVCTMGSCV